MEIVKLKEPYDKNAIVDSPIVLALGFGNTIHNFVNETLSNRPYFSNYYLKNNLFLSLFGTGVVGSYVLDNFLILIV